jgi:hypothetical protein
VGSTSWQERRTIVGGARTVDWQGIWRNILIGVLAVGVIVVALALSVVRRQEQGLRSRLDGEDRSIRFVHDLLVLCSYDRHFCVGSETGTSPLVARILRKSGVNPGDPGNSDDR